MSFELTKSVAKRLNVYPAVRWVHRHVIDREALAQRRADVSFYRSILKPGDLAFDIGANYGDKTAALLEASARVVAFEPQPDCHAELRARIGRNPRMVLQDLAVGSEPGEARFFVRGKRGTSGLVKDWEGSVESEIRVRVTTLKEQFQLHGVPRFLKVDVEGFELQVFKGMDQPVPMICFEYHVRDNGLEQAAECIRFLQTLGSLQVNLSPAERLGAALPEWLDGKEFIKRFSSLVSSTPGAEGYGDLLIRYPALS